MTNATRTIRYTFRLRPGKTAEKALLAEWDRCRWVWNQAVAHLHQTGEFVRDTALTAWRRENPWLAAGSVVAQQQTLRDFRTKRGSGQGRRKANTKGYQRAKRRAAKAHKKVARQRQDTARKWAKKVVTDHGSSPWRTSNPDSSHAPPWPARQPTQRSAPPRPR